MKPQQLTTWRWQRVTHTGRTPIVTCLECGTGTVNESNAMRRAGWQETVSTPRHWRCADCSERAS